MFCIVHGKSRYLMNEALSNNVWNFLTVLFVRTSTSVMVEPNFDLQVLVAVLNNKRRIILLFYSFILYNGSKSGPIFLRFVFGFEFVEINQVVVYILYFCVMSMVGMREMYPRSLHNNSKRENNIVSKQNLGLSKSNY